MAIKISSTEVVSNTRHLKNITGASGKYDDLRTQLSTISTVIDFNTPIMNKVMTANTTFTESNKGLGKTSVLILDTSSSGHTPTFSANIKWAQDTTPSWADYRYWHIGMIGWNSTTVRAVAKGYGSIGGGAPAETISLSGTSGSPNYYLGETSAPSSVSAGIKTKSDGTIWGSLNSADDVQFNAGTEWCNVAPASPGSYYIRCTVNSGTLDALASDNTGTWEPMNNTYNWCCTATNTDRGPKFVTLKLEISTTSNDSNIVATGYYRASAWVTP